MHERRIAHRDLKLENIMLEKDLASRFGGWPNIKLIDFGLSQRLAAPAAPIDAAALSHPVAHSAAMARFTSFASPEEEAEAVAMLAQLEPCPVSMKRSAVDDVARALRPVPRFKTTVGAAASVHCIPSVRVASLRVSPRLGVLHGA
jgi:serine/threonine protein kinase